MKNKLYLKDYIGKDNIDIMVYIDIKGKKHNNNSIDDNKRLLKRVYTKIEKGNTWIYITWKPEGRINYQYNSMKDTFNDCGYSGLMLDNNNHILDNLYLNIA